MIAVTVSLVVAPGNGPALEAAVGDLARATLANEPGVLIYRLCRLPEQEGHYRLIEMYEDQAVLDKHLATDWFKAAGPLVGPLLAQPPVLEQYDVLD